MTKPSDSRGFRIFTSVFWASKPHEGWIYLWSFNIAELMVGIHSSSTASSPQLRRENTQPLHEDAICVDPPPKSSEISWQKLGEIPAFGGMTKKNWAKRAECSLFALFRRLAVCRGVLALALASPKQMECLSVKKQRTGCRVDLRNQAR